jgi:alkylhydroperoxidase family enzyme
MPRNSKQPSIDPLEPPYDDDQTEALELLGAPIALFRVFSRRPELARGIAGWGHYYLSRRSALTVRQRELVIDRVTARCGADYEWGVHIAVFADKAGLTEDQLRSLASEAVGEDGALDVVLVAGWYHAISYAVRALRLPLEPGTAGLGGALSAGR